MSLFPVFVHPAAAGVLDSESAARFTVTWSAHLGVYCGAVVGLIVTIVRARRWMVHRGGAETRDEP